MIQLAGRSRDNHPITTGTNLRFFIVYRSLESDFLILLELVLDRLDNAHFFLLSRLSNNFRGVLFNFDLRNIQADLWDDYI